MLFVHPFETTLWTTISLILTYSIYFYSLILSLTLLFFVLSNEGTKKLSTQVVQISCTNNTTLYILRLYKV
jgi:hypothetical protein